MNKTFDFAQDFIQIEPWPIPKRVYFIAEIGINHNGSLDVAKQLINQAKAAGCDAVKFQKRTIDIVYSPEVLSQSRPSPWGTTQREQKQGLEFGEVEYDHIDAYCRQLGIDWFASAWDIPSQLFLRRYNFTYNKVASAMATNIPFLKEVASEQKQTFLSTGMCTLEQVDQAVDIFHSADCPVVLMHTVSTYPAADTELNLSLIHTLRQRYGLPVGYSGHETSVSPSIMAAMMGAVAIERHITLDRAMYGSDQAASLELPGLLNLLGVIRKIPDCIGDGVKRVLPAEVAVAQKLRYWQDSV
ncbi:N-acetylneuraminate synthase [Cylindrospermopsis raciborskii CHAB3438]|uniref:N-acetylneuraminate synthase family protein n=1 Tax=Cylindrospermopsis raciborskii TaxID=77022 RepID=UPI001F10148A|nr:N-acetylneuraminate synthase family protein [Cylindrospermopsis raciborskii]MCH4903843.1 N-acetylneuraminate synthase [Cylindrospermopsis raciborskii CHAB3438]